MYERKNFEVVSRESHWWDFKEDLAKTAYYLQSIGLSENNLRMAISMAAKYNDEKEQTKSKERLQRSTATLGTISHSKIAKLTLLSTKGSRPQTTPYSFTDALR